MSYRTFFFLLFIISSILFFLSSFQEDFILSLCDDIYQDELTLKYIQLTSMITSSIALILFMINKYYYQRKLLEKRNREAKERLNIEEIHAELEALRE